MDADGLKGWESQKDSQIAQRVENGPGFPPCWGGMFRVNDRGDYITPEQFNSVFPTKKESTLYYAASAANLGITTYEDVAEHASDEIYLTDIVNTALETSDFPIFYTEYYPEDFDESELLTLLPERQDLFDAESKETYPVLQDVIERFQRENALRDVTSLADRCNGVKEVSTGLDNHDTKDEQYHDTNTR